MYYKAKFSKWYNLDVGKHKRAMARPMRSSAKRGPEADSKAVDYARWLLRRDSVPLETIAAEFRERHNENAKPVKTGRNSWRITGVEPIPDYAEVQGVVEWAPCAAGMRPRYVKFWWGYNGHRYGTEPVLKIELPHWSFVHPENVEDLENAA